MRKCGERKQAAVPEDNLDIESEPNFGKGRRRGEKTGKTFKDSKFCRVEQPDTLTDPSCVSVLHF